MRARLAENMPASAEVQNRPAPPRPPFALEEDLRGGDTSQVGANSHSAAGGPHAAAQPPCAMSTAAGAQVDAGELAHTRHSPIPLSAPPQTLSGQTDLHLLNTLGRVAAFRIFFSHTPRAPEFCPKHLRIDKKKVFMTDLLLTLRQAGCRIKTNKDSLVAKTGLWASMRPAKHYLPHSW